MAHSLGTQIAKHYDTRRKTYYWTVETTWSDRLVTGRSTHYKSREEALAAFRRTHQSVPHCA